MPCAGASISLLFDWGASAHEQSAVRLGCECPRTVPRRMGSSLFSIRNNTSAHILCAVGLRDDQKRREAIFIGANSTSSHMLCAATSIALLVDWGASAHEQSSVTWVRGSVRFETTQALSHHALPDLGTIKRDAKRFSWVRNSTNSHMLCAAASVALLFDWGASAHEQSSITWV